MTTISIDRYVGIRDPLKNRNKSAGIVAIKIAAVWMTSVIIGSPLIALGVLRPEQILSETQQCAIFNPYYLIYGSLASFFGPLSIMLIAFSLTVDLLNRQVQQLGLSEANTGMRRCKSDRKQRVANAGCSLQMELKLIGPLGITSAIAEGRRPFQASNNCSPTSKVFPNCCEASTDRDGNNQKESLPQASSLLKVTQKLIMLDNRNASGTENIAPTRTGLKLGAKKFDVKLTSESLGDGIARLASIEGAEYSSITESIPLLDKTRKDKSKMILVTRSSLVGDSHPKRRQMIKQRSSPSIIDVNKPNGYCEFDTKDINTIMASTLVNQSSNIDPAVMTSLENVIGKPYNRVIVDKLPGHQLRKLTIDEDRPNQSVDIEGSKIESNVRQSATILIDNTDTVTESLILNNMSGINQASVTRSNEIIPETLADKECSGYTQNIVSSFKGTNDCKVLSYRKESNIIKDVDIPTKENYICGKDKTEDGLASDFKLEDSLPKKGDIINLENSCNITELSTSNTRLLNKSEQLADVAKVTGKDMTVIMTEYNVAKKPSIVRQVSGTKPTTGEISFKSLIKKHGAAFQVVGMLEAKRVDRRTTEMKNVRTEQKAIKVIGTMFVMFFICWAPFFASNLTLGVCPDCRIDARLFKIFLWLGYTSSTLNPIIYTIFNSTFKNSFVRLLKFECCVPALRRSWSANGRSYGRELLMAAESQSCSVVMRAPLSRMVSCKK